jgi:adenylate kinase family enzyme
VRIYFTGASGTGKSSLAAFVKRRHGWPILPSAVRQAMEDWGISTLDELFRDTQLADNFNLSVWRIQRKLEEEALGQDRSRHFIAERCFDCVAYAAELTRIAWQITRSQEFDSYLMNLRTRDALVFFVRPHHDLLAKRIQLDGRRDSFLDPALVCRLDGAIQFILHSHDIPHVNVAAQSLRDREQVVEHILNRFKGQ